ncbi:putative ribosome biogenesis protein C8F11.04 [Olea europaea var. sylvestris]|uniref:putative ribosome biogenesis protein C8F11.04 n=1 Tax=Olea europaea var. sylvestris TaxID=158386 RepID=UPI000C1D4100|nr:putative ribosome biogenesis protein C8F11.04 [Olea europaea var. sylvestris]
MDSLSPFVASSSKVDRSSIESAVNALIKYKAKQSASEKPQLLPQDDYIYLNLTLKKIPTNPPTNPFKIPIPHPLLDPTSEFCLIIDDRQHSPTPSSEDIKKLIKSQNIPLSKVLKISKLKTNYKPFEAKRKLCDSYDLFLVDKRVVHLLPKLLGKQFFKKKKLPLGVDLSKKNLNAQVERSLGSALLYLRTGTCCVMRVGKAAMEKEEIVENVVSVVEAVAEKVPKKWNGVRSLHLKFSDSVALPIYQALPDMKLKIDGIRESKKEDEEVVDNKDKENEVSGRKEGEGGKKKKKGRIHEVRYMDFRDEMVNDEDEVEDEATVSEDDNEHKGEEVDLMEENNEKEDLSESIIDDDLYGNELGGNKRKKRAVKARELRDLNEEKEMKKSKSNRGGGKLKKDGLKKIENKKEATDGMTKLKDTKSKKRELTN